MEKQIMKKHLITLYARSPIHVGSGSSIDVVDLPIMRERITAFPVIPSTSLKGVLLQWSREKWLKNPRENKLDEKAEILFGYSKKVKKNDGEEQITAAGCVQIMEAKILAFPVRSLSGCFAWITCPTVLERFNRDTGKNVPIPKVEKDKAVAGNEIIISVTQQVVLEEYALKLQNGGNAPADKVAKELLDLVDDPVWKNKLITRLAIVHDENFQHIVTTCTEINTRIAIDPQTRTNATGALFSQENVPSESVFYSVLHILPPRCKNGELKLEDAEKYLDELLGGSPVILQIGGDETTGFGLCEVKKIKLS